MLSRVILVVLGAAVIVLLWGLRKRSKQSGAAPGLEFVHPAYDLMPLPPGKSRPPFGKGARFDPYPFRGAIVLLKLPADRLTHLSDPRSEVPQVLAMLLAAVWGKEADFEVKYDGSYQLSEATLGLLKSRCIYWGISKEVIVTSAKLNDEEGYNLIGQPVPFFYARALASKLRWDPMMLNDGVPGLKDIYEWQDSFGMGHEPLHRAPKKRRFFRKPS